MVYKFKNNLLDYANQVVAGLNQSLSTSILGGVFPTMIPAYSDPGPWLDVDMTKLSIKEYDVFGDIQQFINDNKSTLDWSSEKLEELNKVFAKTFDFYCLEKQVIDYDEKRTTANDAFRHLRRELTSLNIRFLKKHPNGHFIGSYPDRLLLRTEGDEFKNIILKIQL